MIDDIVCMIKALMEDAPSLQEGFLSSDKKIRETARMEIVDRLQKIDAEVEKAGNELKLPPLEVWKQVYDPKHYKPQELRQLQEWLQLLHQQRAAIFRKRRHK